MKRKIWLNGLLLMLSAMACKKNVTEVETANPSKTAGKMASTSQSNSVIAAGAQNDTWYDFDPDNDNWDKALTLSKGKNYTGKLITENDEDCYVIDLSGLTGKGYAVKLEGNPGYKFICSSTMTPYNGFYTQNLHEFMLTRVKKLYLKVKMQSDSNKQNYKWDPNAVYKIRFDDWDYNPAE